MKYEKPTIYNTAEQHKRIFDELSVAKAVIKNNNELIADLSKKVERLQEQLKEANKTTKDQELITKKLKRRRICDNQKTEARKEHINELIEQVKELKEEIARRGRIINELKSQRKEANAIIEDMRPFVQASMSRQTFTRILSYEDKWGVK